MSKFFTSLIVTAIMNCTFLSHAIAQDVIVYRGGTLVDPSQDAPLENAVIVIRDGYIVSVGSEDTTPIPNDANIIDITGH